MNKKCLFSITNVLLVGILGLLLGLFCKDIFSTSAGVGAFICFLITLCIPALTYFFAAKAGSPAIIMCLLLLVAELAIDIPFMVKPSFDVKYFVIFQSIAVGLFLGAMLVFIALSGKDKEAK